MSLVTRHEQVPPRTKDFKIHFKTLQDIRHVGSLATACMDTYRAHLRSQTLKGAESWSIVLKISSKQINTGIGCYRMQYT